MLFAFCRVLEKFKSGLGHHFSDPARGGRACESEPEAHAHFESYREEDVKKTSADGDVDIVDRTSWTEISDYMMEEVRQGITIVGSFSETERLGLSLDRKTLNYKRDEVWFPFGVFMDDEEFNCKYSRVE